MGPPVFAVPLCPVMVGEEERKIVEHNSTIFLTRLPTLLKLSTPQKHRYDRYKGTRLLQDKTVMDKRFESLYDSLSERKSASKPAKRKLYLARASTFI